MSRVCVSSAVTERLCVAVGFAGHFQMAFELRPILGTVDFNQQSSAQANIPKMPFETALITGAPFHSLSMHMMHRRGRAPSFLPPRTRRSGAVQSLCAIWTGNRTAGWHHPVVGRFWTHC